VGGPQCSLQLSLKLLIGRQQIQIRMRMRITEELDFSESSAPAAEAVVEGLTEFGKPPSGAQISRKVAVGDARELRSANACSTSLLKSPCGEHAWMLDAESS
jgi:hypothetical protein